MSDAKINIKIIKSPFSGETINILRSQNGCITLTGEDVSASLNRAVEADTSFCETKIRGLIKHLKKGSFYIESQNYQKANSISEAPINWALIEGFSKSLAKVRKADPSIFFISMGTGKVSYKSAIKIDHLPKLIDFFENSVTSIPFNDKETKKEKSEKIEKELISYQQVLESF